LTIDQRASAGVSRRAGQAWGRSSAAGVGRGLGAVLVLLVSILGGAVYLSIGQALVGLVKSADTVSAVARVLYIALIVLGTLGLAGALGSAWKSIARWTPVGTVMTLFGGVLNLSAWSGRDTLSLVVSVAYIVVFAGIGIRWFQWVAR
jgi:ABC-2 type transport system permease protein